MPGYLPQKNPHQSWMDTSPSGDNFVSSAVEGYNSVGGFLSKLGNALSVAGETTLKNALQAGITCTSIGANGSLMDIDTEVKIHSIYSKYIMPYYDRVGYPSGKTLQLDLIRGFCKCINAEVDENGMLKDEHEALCSIMNTGFYIE